MRETIVAAMFIVAVACIIAAGFIVHIAIGLAAIAACACVTAFVMMRGSKDGRARNP